ncbi:MAG: hypothetical protein AAF604_16265 [Acidobacteriota bacterium]
MNDEQLLAAFEAGELDAESFDHQAHLRIAWLLLRRWPLAKALDRLGDGLRRLTASVGMPEAYHETVTWAYAFLIRERMDRGAHATFEEFRDAYPELMRRSPSLLRDYYSETTLDSEAARRTFRLPDRAAETLAGAPSGR